MVFSVCCHARQVWSTKQQFLYAHPSGPFTTQCCSGMNQQTCANMDIYTPGHIILFFFFFFCFLFFVLFGQAFLRLVMRTQRSLERGWDSRLVLLGMCCWEFEIGPTQIPRGGHWPRKGVWGCAALKTPFSRLFCRSQGSHFKQKSPFTRPPLEKIQKF